MKKIEIFDFDSETNSLSNRRKFVDIDISLGTPDGFTMDNEDNIWLGLWGGNAVLEIKKDGTFGRKLDVPAVKASSCCFAGEELNDLIITTASKDDEEEYPLSGYVFLEKLNVKGKTSFRYKF